MKLSGALVGFGKIAETTHLEALAEAGLEVTAIAEPDLERRRRAKELTGARVYPTIQELLATERPRFVDICTPPHLHHPTAVLALEAGAHVLCEKPLVLHLAEGLELGQLARARELAVACIHNWTQAPILLRMGEWIRSGKLGALEHIEMTTLRTEPAAVAPGGGNWRVDPARAGGGILFDHGWHGISILLRLTARAPLSVRGRTARRKYVALSVEDTAEITLEFAGGINGRFEATWAAEERANRATARLEHGLITLENDRLRVERGRDILAEERFAESLAGGGYRPRWTARIVREFRDEIDEPSHRGRSLAEALTCLQLVELAYASARRDGAPMAALPLHPPTAQPLPVATRS